jgi:hypothetical protein
VTYLNIEGHSHSSVLILRMAKHVCSSENGIRFQAVEKNCKPD